MDATDPDVARLADDIQRFVYGGDSEERAAARLAGYGVPESGSGKPSESTVSASGGSGRSVIHARC